MILSGLEIKKRLHKTIEIDPYEENRLNPNSYNLTLHHELLVYESHELDMKKKNEVRRIEIPPEGLVLEPGRLYLGSTVEYTAADDCVPMLEGRSSIGRLGLYVHVTAGFGDVGFHGCWTLEISCIQPIRVYAGVEICQIYFHTIAGAYEPYVSNKYQNNRGVQPSLLYKDFERESKSK